MDGTGEAAAAMLLLDMQDNPLYCFAMVTQFIKLTSVELEITSMTFPLIILI